MKELTIEECPELLRGMGYEKAAKNIEKALDNLRRAESIAASRTAKEQIADAAADQICVWQDAATNKERARAIILAAVELAYIMGIRAKTKGVKEPAAQPQRSEPQDGPFRYCGGKGCKCCDARKQASGEPQEWTAQTVRALAGTSQNQSNVTGSGYQAIADAHKAELDAVDKDRIAACNNYIDALTQLAAERENFEIEVERGNQYCKQLLAAEAAIAAHNNDPEMVDKCGKFTVELSDLEQHDKETRKPLVEALKELRQHCFFMVPAREIIDAALASVKSRYTGEATGEGE